MDYCRNGQIFFELLFLFIFLLVEKELFLLFLALQGKVSAEEMKLKNNAYKSN